MQFITNFDDGQEAVASLFTDRVKVAVLTKGCDGAAIYLKNGESYEDKGFKVAVSDTTGAGDAFISGFLSELMSIGIAKQTLCEQ
ncbi:MAG: carbohydrate kinase family protein [Bacillota bacterium]